MTVSLDRRLTLRALMETSLAAGGKDRHETMLKGAVEGLLLAERDRRVAEAHAPWREGVPLGLHRGAKCWTTLWGSLEQVRVPRLRGWKEIGAAGALRAAMVWTRCCSL